MKKLVKDALLDALVSGEYNHTRYHLHKNDESFCVIGVLCDLYIQDDHPEASWKTPNFTSESVFFHDGRRYHGGFSPHRIEQWAGLTANESSELMAVSDASTPGDWEPVIQYIQEKL